jgi:hypothetical protein
LDRAKACLSKSQRIDARQRESDAISCYCTNIRQFTALEGGKKFHKLNFFSRYVSIDATRGCAAAIPTLAHPIQCRVALVCSHAPEQCAPSALLLTQEQLCVLFSSMD